MAQNDRLRKEVKQLEAAARQTSNWADKAESSKMGKGAATARKKGHAGTGSKEYKAEKSRKMQQRRKNLERRQQVAIDEKSGLLTNVEAADSLKLHPLKYHTSLLVSVEELAVAYDSREVFSGVSFTLEQGERVALVGGNGSGKSSIIKLICVDGGAGSVSGLSGDGSGGVRDGVPHTGRVKIGSRLIFSYVPQDTSFLSGGLSSFAKSRQIDESLLFVEHDRAFCDNIATKIVSL